MSCFWHAIFSTERRRAHMVVVVLSTLAYAAAAIAVAARLFGAEAVLYSEQGQWQDFFRRPHRQRSAPSPAAALFCVAVVFPLSVLAGGLLSQLSVPAPTRLLIGIGMSAALFLGVPALVAWRANINLVTSLAIHRTRILSFASAVLVGTAMWPLAAEMLVVEKKIGFSTMPEVVEKHLSDLVRQQQEIPSYVVLLALAVAPAAFEEIFFRGWLFAALERSMKPAYVVLITSIAFGLFHIFTGGVLLVERLLPTTMVGLSLGWVRWHSRSIFPGMLLHLAHNGLIVSASLFPAALAPMSRAPGLESCSRRVADRRSVNGRGRNRARVGLRDPQPCRHPHRLADFYSYAIASAMRNRTACRAGISPATVAVPMAKALRMALSFQGKVTGNTNPDSS